jgi:hypothetical protein
MTRYTTSCRNGSMEVNMSMHKITQTDDWLVAFVGKTLVMGWVASATAARRGAR